jgi:hypothetical protein
VSLNPDVSRADFVRDVARRLLLVTAILSCEVALWRMFGSPDPAGEIPLDVHWLLWMASQGVLQLRRFSSLDRIPRASVPGRRTGRRDLSGPFTALALLAGIYVLAAIYGRGRADDGAEIQIRAAEGAIERLDRQVGEVPGRGLAHRALE